MLRKLPIIGAVVAIAAFALVTLVPSAGASDDATRWIRVNSFVTEQRFIDEAPHGESVGDQLVFSARLMKLGKRVGDFGAVCTVTSVQTGTLQCNGTARFVRWFHGGGQIAVQALVSGQGTTFTVPITGGSGGFVEADGQLHIRRVSDTQEVLTFELRG